MSVCFRPQRQIQGKGVADVENRSLSFLPSDETRRPGFKLDYQSLTLHALTPATPDLEGHLYCQIDDGQVDDSGAGNGDEDEYGEMRELRVFVGEGKRTFLPPKQLHCLALPHRNDMLITSHSYTTIRSIVRLFRTPRITITHWRTIVVPLLPAK